MNQISIAFCAPNANIHINYHHEVQSLIYTLARSAENKKDAQYHDKGVGQRQYKLFTFSMLRGRNTIKNKRITFEEMIYLDVRGVYNNFCDDIAAELERKPTLNLCGQPLTVHSAEVKERGITDSRLNIRMLSPLEAHTTEKNKHTRFYMPLDRDFSEQINANFQRKWKAYTGNPPIGNIEIAALSVNSKDKYVTTYKGFYINGWLGEYTLTGNPEYLNFLYYCGLGSRNSGGFGMFKIQ